MTTTTGKIILGVGIIILAVATWFAFRKPVPITLPASVTNASSAATGAAVTDATPGGGTTAATGSTGSAGGVGAQAAAKSGPIVFIAPTSTSELVIGQQYTIEWSRPGNVADGQLYLVAEKTGAIIGWVQQSIGLSQVMFPWSVASVFISRTNPNAKVIVPGEYYLKLSYESAQVAGAVSAPFAIVATTTKD
jgi:hypothetical protein